MHFATVTTMSEPEHKGASPGPWMWRTDERWFELFDATGKSMEIETTEANGRVLPGDLALIASAPEMAAMLRQLEWVDVRSEQRHCPVCHEGEGGLVVTDAGHAPDCRLATLLDKVGR